jgi:hypothetical protein
MKMCISFSGSTSSSPPSITQHPISRTVVRNDPVTLDCRATGHPDPVVEWYRDGRPVVLDPASREGIHQFSRIILNSDS